jgi:hypothetical protein
MEKLADKLQDPLIIKNAADGTRRLFVGEQKGLIHIFHENGTKYPRLFLDISGKIFNKTTHLGERGLLGLAFHPDCQQNRITDLSSIVITIWLLYFHDDSF